MVVDNNEKEVVMFTNTEEFGKKIKEIREELGMSISEIADIVAVPEEVWKGYEEGNQIDVSVFPDVLKTLCYPDFMMASIMEDSIFDKGSLEKFWCNSIETEYGTFNAALMTEGMLLLGLNLHANLDMLKRLPRGTHVGELVEKFESDPYYRWNGQDGCVFSLEEDLPERYLMSYDYDFVYNLITVYNNLFRRFRSLDFSNIEKNLSLGNVAEELIVYLALTFVKDYDTSFLEEIYLDEEVVDQFMNEYLYEDSISNVESLYNDTLGNFSENSSYDFKNWFQEYTIFS